MQKLKRLPDKFYGAKPLIWYKSDDYSMYLYDESFRIDPVHSLYQMMPGQKMEEKECNFIYEVSGIEKKLIKYDFLYQMDGPAQLVHKTVLSRLKQLCPNDFQAFPATIKNMEGKKQDFENYDYYVLHIIPFIDAVDKDRSIIKIKKLESGAELWDIENLVLKENCMGKYLLALANIEYQGIAVFAPELARELIYSKGISFYSDLEDVSWGENALPYKAPLKLKSNRNNNLKLCSSQSKQNSNIIPFFKKKLITKKVKNKK